MTSSQTSLDIYEVCGAVIESFQERQAKVAELIWRLVRTFALRGSRNIVADH